MSYKKVYLMLFFLVAFRAKSKHCQVSDESTVFSLNDAQMRFARHRCLQQFPQAEILNYTDTHETQCFFHCFLYKAGLTNLTTRGLSSQKIFDVWEKIERTFEDDTCLERFDFDESLSGRCSDTFRKLMEFRSNCWELFEYIFTPNIVWKSQDTKISKNIGQSASEFCDLKDGRDVLTQEKSEFDGVSILSHYKDKLKCILENIHYLDAYGRVDENEINLSYQEVHEDSAESRAVVHECSYRANSNYQQGYLGNSVYVLQKCLRAQSPVFDKVFKMRDELSRQY